MRGLVSGAFLVACVLAAAWLTQSYWQSSPVEPPLHNTALLPDFTLPDLDDQPRSIGEWSGQPLVINFWATWCAPCRREIPLLQSVQDEHGDGSLQVIGVALDNLQDVKRFVSERHVTYPILYGEDDATAIAESFGADFVGLPFSAFIAPGGEVLALLSGELEAEYLDLVVAEMNALASGEHSVAEVQARLSVD